MAEQIRREAEQAEPFITLIMKTVADSLGGELKGLRHRLKTKKSLVNRVDRASKHGWLDPLSADTKKRVFDPIRYTVTFRNDDDFVDRVNATIDEIQRRGYSLVRTNNFFGSDPYKGYNVSFDVGRDNLRFEVQFHTPETYQAKTASHPIYKELQNGPDNPQRRNDLINQMIAVWENVEAPPRWQFLRGTKL